MQQPGCTRNSAILTHAPVTFVNPQTVTDMTPEHLSLAQLSADLNQCTGERPPTYRHLYELVLSGQPPADRKNNRWYILRSDVKPIAIMLGLLTSDGRKLPDNVPRLPTTKPVPLITIAEARAALSRRKCVRSDSESVAA